MHIAFNIINPKKTINVLLMLVFLCFSQIASAAHTFSHDHSSFKQEFTCQICLTTVFDDDDYELSSSYIRLDQHPGHHPLAVLKNVHVNLLTCLYQSRAPPQFP